MSEAILDGTSEDVPGHRILEGTDLEVAYNLEGGDLVLRVNKQGAGADIPGQAGRRRQGHGGRRAAALQQRGTGFHIQDGRKPRAALSAGLGLDDEQLARLQTKLLG